MLKFGFVALVSFVLGFVVSHRRKPALAGLPVAETSEEKTRLARGRELLFMVGWLIAWTAGIIMAAGIVARGGAGGATPFLLGWLLAAIAGWFSAMSKLVALLQAR